MKKFVIAFAIAATTMTGIAATHPHPARFGRVAAKLNLTDAQRQQIRDLRQSDRQKNAQLYADFRAKARQYRELKRAGDPNAENVKAELQPLREQVRAARKASREAFLGVLTPEQRQQLDQWRAEHPRKRG